MTLPQAQRFAAYLPASLVRDILRNQMAEPGQPRRLTAATLFADVAGFTRLAEELATDGPRGAEELNRILLQLFDATITVIEQIGGCVSHFYGDAMLVYFPEQGDAAAQRAGLCAAHLQTLMATQFQQVTANRPAGKPSTFSLGMKIGLGYGECLEIIVGDEQAGMEFVLTGASVEQAAAAEKRATTGQIVASPAYQQAIGRRAEDYRPIPVAQLAGELWDGASPLIAWADFSPTDWARVAAVGRHFLPTALVERLSAETTPLLAEHRPAVSIFVQFDGIQVSAPTGGQQLQAYYLWANALVARFAPEAGRVNRILTGDKGNQLHIIFGAPVAPHLPEQALRCALALQHDRLPTIRAQRVGLSIGNVFAGPLGSRLRHEYTIVGDVVNLAARLTQLCPDGQVWLDTFSANRLQRDFEFEVMPATTMKGKSGLVPVCRALRERLGVALLSARFRRFTRPLIGREAELARLYARLDATLNLEGNLTLVTGPAGVGKSHFLALAVSYWLNGGGAGYVGACQPHLSETPFGPWLQIWQAQFGLHDAMTPAQQAEALLSVLEGYNPTLVAEAGLWGDILGLPLSLSAHLAELTGRERQMRFFEHVRACLAALEERQPLLLVIEDIHLADEASLALLDFVANRLTHRPLGLLLSGRDADLSLTALHGPLADIMPLFNWQPAQARLGLQNLLQTTQIPPELVEYFGLNHDTELNPFFLEEAVRVMRETGALVERDGYVAFQSARFDPTFLPDSVHGLLLARLDRLPAASRQIVQRAAVIGEQFDGQTLTDALELAEDAPLAHWLEGLVSAEILEPISSGASPTYLFRHALMRDAAYQSLPFQDRRRIHALAAASLARRHADHLRPLYATLAYHYSQAAAAQPAFHYAVAAAQDAYAIYANREAVRLFALALAQLSALPADPAWSELADLYLARGHALMHMGRFSESQDSFQRVRYLADQYHDRARRAAADLRLAELFIRQAQYGAAQKVADDLLAECGPDLAPQWRAMAYRWSGHAAGALGQPERALAQLREAERICLGAGLNRQLVSILDTIAYIQHLQGDLAGALLALQRSATLARRYSTPFSIAESLNNIALMQRMLGSYEQALATLDEALSLAADTSRAAFAVILGNKASVLAALGRFDEARAAFHESIGLLVATDDHYYLVEIYLLFAFNYHCVRRDWSAATDCLRHVQRLITARPESYGEEQIRLWLGMAWSSWGQGRYKMARRWLEKAVKACQKLAQPTRWRPVLAYVQGLVAQAQQQTAAAILAWEEGVRYVLEEQGHRAFLPLLYFELAQAAVGEARQLAYWEQCWLAAQAHAYHSDRRRCALTAGPALLASADPGQQALGRAALSWAENAPAPA